MHYLLYQGIDVHCKCRITYLVSLGRVHTFTIVMIEASSSTCGLQYLSLPSAQFHLIISVTMGVESDIHSRINQKLLPEPKPIHNKWIKIDVFGILRGQNVIFYVASLNYLGNK